VLVDGRLKKGEEVALAIQEALTQNRLRRRGIYPAAQEERRPDEKLRGGERLVQGDGATQSRRH
jgi:hypothetical protein